MDFREYSEMGYDLYSEFASAVRRIALLALDESESSSRLQASHARAKSRQSLRKKLEMRGLLESNEVEAEIKDLAGCRLIFYTNNDVNDFLASRLIIDNFEVDWDKSRIHQPVEATDPAYVATHYVVRLKEERLNLPEYRKFRGLQCEIQIQSILNHAWSETSHDIVYKRPTLVGFGSKEFQSIERRMQEIMTKYLMPAGYEFQKIEIDFKRLLEGKELLEEGGLDKLKLCEDNNSRFEILEKFRDFVLPQYDDVVAAFPGIRSELVEVVKSARLTDTIPIETPFGTFDGKSHEQIADVALQILERIRYVDVDEVFSALCEIYRGKKTESEGERILNAVESLAGHNLNVWKQAGPYVQSRICEHISALDAKELEEIFPVTIRALSQVLSTEAESTSSTYESVTLYRAAVQPSAELSSLRDRALQVLEGMYSSERPEQERRQILIAIWEATDTPRLGQSSDELDLMILKDSTRVVRFLSAVAASESYEMNQHFEQLALWLFKRYLPWSKDASNAERAEACQKLIDAILVYRDQLNEDSEFVVYKTLVGFESVFPPDWEDPDFDHRAQGKYRQERINELLQSVDGENADMWQRRIIRCAQTKSFDGAKFFHFGPFLESLAETRPQMIMAWLQDLDSKLERFLPSIVIGLEKSADADSARHMIASWIDEGRNVGYIARAVRFSDELDTDRLNSIATAAIANDDVPALIDIIATVLQKGTEENISDIKGLALRCIAHCTELAENRWVHDAWIYTKDSVLLGQLDTDDVQVFLDNLSPISKIDYHVEVVLRRLAEDYPDSVLAFLGDRIRFDRGADSPATYDAIPFSFHELDKVLVSHPDKIVRLCRDLFDEDDAMFEFRGGRLIRIVFSEFTDDLEDAIVAQIEGEDDSSVDFVLTVLRTYEGQTFLHNLLQQIVCVLEEDDRRLGLVEIILETSGTVSGEFGMRDAYQRKKKEISPWLQDERKKVRLFAERYSRSLDRQIAAEQRRAEEDVEMRKREFGESEEPDGA